MRKKLRAVLLAVESFLPQLRGRRVLAHEDNTAVVAALTNLTSRSPVMIEELRKRWHFLDIHDISPHARRARYRLASGAPWITLIVAVKVTGKDTNSTAARYIVNAI
eukprot:jgi/Tetstr1/431370/TSEL_021061.t1